MSTKNNRILAPEGGKYPFKVSDEYFDNLTARIMEQIDSVEQEVPAKVEEAPAQSAKLFSIHKNRRRNLWISTMSIAASLTQFWAASLEFFMKRALVPTGLFMMLSTP